MGFIMDGLDAEAYDRTYKDGQLIGRIFDYFRPKIKIVIFVTALVVLTSLLDTIYPLLLSSIIDTMFVKKVMQTAISLVGFVLVSAVLSWTANLFRQWYTARAVGDVVLQLRE